MSAKKNYALTFDQKNEFRQTDYDVTGVRIRLWTGFDGYSWFAFGKFSVPKFELYFQSKQNFIISSDFHE